MVDWQETYRELKEKRTFYGIAEVADENEADNYFDWLGTKYSSSVSSSIQKLRDEKESSLNDAFKRENTNSIIATLNSIVDSKKSEFRTEAKSRLKRLFENKNSNPIFADFQKIDDKDMRELEEVIEGVQFDSESIVFFTNALIEELYLEALPGYFNKLLINTGKKFSDLSGVKWEEARKKLFNVFHNDFSGCKSENLEELGEKLKIYVRELEEIIKSAESKPAVIKQPKPPTPPISTPGGDDEVGKEMKKIQDEIDGFRNKYHTGRTDDDRSTLIKNLKEKRGWASSDTSTKTQKEAAVKKYSELEKAIEDLELEILQYKAIQKIKDELDDKRNRGKVKLKNDDLTEPDYTIFDSKIFQLKSKEEVDDFKNRVIEDIISLREPYSLLNETIERGEKGLKENNHDIIQNVFGTLETYHIVASDRGRKVHEQKSGIIYDLKTRLLRVLLEQQAQQLHIDNQK